MTDEITRNDLPDELPEAIVDTQRRVSSIWLIPVVAILAAIWLGYRAYTEQGPLVTIHFDTAEGLEAGITQVRYKDVNIGRVETIGLSNDLSKVKISARLNYQISDYLTEGTRFWVVRPRFARGQISGLGTLVGGAYIAVDLTDSGDDKRSFVGLESPPLVASSDPGTTFTLRADDLGSLSIGSPVTYRDIEVGHVASFELMDPAGVEIKVFINAPHDDKVRHNTRFWNASGVGVTLDAEGLQVQTESMASLLLGGISFGLREGETLGEAPDPSTTYALYPDRESAEEFFYEYKEPWMLEFSGSVRGLSAGAPVEFRGIRVGTVREVKLELDVAARKTNIPVRIDIEPERLGFDVADQVARSGPSGTREFWDQLVAQGLRAQLKSGNLLTGALYVGLDFHPDDPPKTITWVDNIGHLPTIPQPLQELERLATRLGRLPLEKVVTDLDESLIALSKLLDQANSTFSTLGGSTLPQTSRTLEQADQTLAAATKLLSPGSPLQSEAQRMMQELSAAARSIRIMADYLERHPEALIRGKGANP